MNDDFLSEELIEATYQFCYKRLNSAQDAEDLAQDILCEALRSIRAGRQVDSFFPWYWALARNRFNMFLRLRRHGAVSLETIGGDVAASDAAPVDGALLSEEEAAALSRSISRLSALNRQIVILYYLRGMRVSGIARELGVPAGTVKRRLFDARNDIRKGVENMTSNGKASYAPAQLSLNGGYSIPDYWDRINDLMTKQIFVSCARDARTLREIADEIGVAPVYFEDKIKYLLENKFLKEASNGRYLTDFCVYDRREYGRFWSELSRVYTDIGRELTETLLGCETDIRALGFYGSDFAFGRLLWVLYVDAVDMLSVLMMNACQSKWAGRVPEGNGKTYRLLGICSYPDDEPDEFEFAQQSVPWSNLHRQFKTSQYRLVDYANLFQCEPFPDRDRHIHEGNADLFMRIFDNPALALTPLEEESAAHLVRLGYLARRGGGLYPAMPVMTYACKAELDNILKKALSGLSAKYAEAVVEAGEKLLLPATRKDLYEEFAHYVMKTAFFPIGYVFHYAMHGVPLEIPPDYAASAAGVALYVTK